MRRRSRSSVTINKWGILLSKRSMQPSPFTSVTMPQLLRPTFSHQAAKILAVSVHGLLRSDPMKSLRSLAMDRLDEHTRIPLDLHDA